MELNLKAVGNDCAALGLPENICSCIMPDKRVHTYVSSFVYRWNCTNSNLLHQHEWTIFFL